jgi:hypothetical protein
VGQPTNQPVGSSIDNHRHQPAKLAGCLIGHAKNFSTTMPMLLAPWAMHGPRSTVCCCCRRQLLLLLLLSPPAAAAAVAVAASCCC